MASSALADWLMAPIALRNFSTTWFAIDTELLQNKKILFFEDGPANEEPHHW